MLKQNAQRFILIMRNAAQRWFDVTPASLGAKRTRVFVIVSRRIRLSEERRQANRADEAGNSAVSPWGHREGNSIDPGNVTALRMLPSLIHAVTVGRPADDEKPVELDGG